MSGVGPQTSTQVRVGLHLCGIYLSVHHHHNVLVYLAIHLASVYLTVSSTSVLINAVTLALSTAAGIDEALDKCLLMNE